MYYLCRVKFFNCWKSTTSTWFTLNVNPKNTKYLLNCANKTSGSPKRPPSQHSGVDKKPHLTPFPRAVEQQKSSRQEQIGERRIKSTLVSLTNKSRE